MKNYDEVEEKHMHDAANGAVDFFIAVVIVITLWYLW